MNVLELENTDNSPDRVRLMVLRNPWGKGEWEGAWSEESKELEPYKDQLEEFIKSLSPDEQFELGSDDGIFLMHYNDWKDTFSTLFLNLDFPDDWTGVRFSSAWTPQNSGGLPHSYTTDCLE